MLALLSPILGIIGSLLPSIIRIFERAQELKYELEITKIKIDASLRQAELQVDVENIKADVAEGQSVRDHDKSINGGVFLNALRVSIRPVITYLFFAIFVAVKIAAAYVMINAGADIPMMLKAVWDLETMALFSTIMAFWFGSRTIEHMDKRVKTTPTFSVTVSPKVLTVTPNVHTPPTKN